MGLLSDFRLSVIEKNLGVYGIHVYQNGKTLAEHRFRSNDSENLYSASKTFSSVGTGIADREGRFSLSDYVLDYLKPRLFDVLEIVNPQWNTYQHGTRKSIPRIFCAQYGATFFPICRMKYLTLGSGSGLFNIWRILYYVFGCRYQIKEKK